MRCCMTSLYSDDFSSRSSSSSSAVDAPAWRVALILTFGRALCSTAMQGCGLRRLGRVLSCAGHDIERCRLKWVFSALVGDCGNAKHAEALIACTGLVDDLTILS